MSVKDLTLKEVERAQNWGLSPERYDIVRIALREEFQEQYFRQFQAEYEQQIRKDLLPEVAEELTPKLRAEIEKEVQKKLPDQTRRELRVEVEAALTAEKLAEMRVQVQKELAAQAPSPKNRDSFKKYLRDGELDCQTSARCATELATRWASRSTWRGWIWGTVSWVLFLAVFPLTLYLYMRHGWTFHTFHLYMVLVPWLLSWVFASQYQTQGVKKASETSQKLLQVAGQYRNLADYGKRLRLVDGEDVARRGDLVELMRDFQRQKNTLDSAFQPEEAVRTKSRVQVLDQAMGEMNTEQLIRIETEELADEPEESEEAVRRRSV